MNATNLSTSGAATGATAPACFEACLPNPSSSGRPNCSAFVPGNVSSCSGIGAGNGSNCTYYDCIVAAPGAPVALPAPEDKGFPVAAVIFTVALGLVLLVWLGLQCQRRSGRLRPPKTRQFKHPKGGLDYHAKDQRLHKGAPTPLMSTVAEMRALARRSPANKHKKKTHKWDPGDVPYAAPIKPLPISPGHELGALHRVSPTKERPMQLAGVKIKCEVDFSGKRKGGKKPNALELALERAATMDAQRAQQQQLPYQLTDGP